MPGIFFISTTIFNTTYCGGKKKKKKNQKKKTRNADLMKTILQKIKKEKLCSS